MNGLGIAPIIAAAVSGVSAVISSTKKNKAARKDMRGSIEEYQRAMMQIRSENKVLDEKIAEVQNLLSKLRRGTPVNGLGKFCLFNCETKQVTRDLQRIADEYNSLAASQEQKLVLLESLNQELEKYTKSDNLMKIGLIVAGSLVAVAAIYYITQ
jgi:SMC interacting uncharacterized protein involved in chromosome segregation